jgi:hypothetical protein
MLPKKTFTFGKCHPELARSFIFFILLILPILPILPFLFNLLIFISFILSTLCFVNTP